MTATCGVSQFLISAPCRWRCLSLCLSVCVCPFLSLVAPRRFVSSTFHALSLPLCLCVFLFPYGSLVSICLGLSLPAALPICLLSPLLQNRSDTCMRLSLLSRVLFFCSFLSLLRNDIPVWRVHLSGEHTLSSGPRALLCGPAGQAPVCLGIHKDAHPKRYGSCFHLSLLTTVICLGTPCISQ